MVYVDTVDKLLDRIVNDKTIVYGTGYVAERFIGSLQMKGLQSKISKCVTTIKHQDFFMGYEVIDIQNLPEQYRGELICIAVHESIKDEIINILDKYSFENIIWIYPFQIRLRFGEPIEMNKMVDLVRILKTTKEDYRIAVRLAAIEQYYGKSECGYSIYVKAQSMHCDEDTAQKRLLSFVKLIESWEKCDCLNEQMPAIAQNYEIIDGVHRLSLALYHGVKRISCDIYRVDSADFYRGELVDLRKEVVEKAGFTNTEFDILCKIQCRVLNNLPA